MPKHPNRQRPNRQRPDRHREPELVRRDGALCVTFVNCASKKRRGFTTYAQLVTWGAANGVLTGGEAQRLERAAADRPEDAAAVAERAAQLRRRLGRVLAALTLHQGPPAADLEALNREISAAMSAQRVIPDATGFRWAWGDRDGDDLDRMLWPVLLSFADLLCSNHHRRVRQCAGEDCDLLFVDRTPGSPRRWCSMRACGARVKSRRHYQLVVKPYKKSLRML